MHPISLWISPKELTFIICVTGLRKQTHCAAQATREIQLTYERLKKKNLNKNPLSLLVRQTKPKKSSKNVLFLAFSAFWSIFWFVASRTYLNNLFKLFHSIRLFIWPGNAFEMGRRFAIAQLSGTFQLITSRSTVQIPRKNLLRLKIDSGTDLTETKLPLA